MNGFQNLDVAEVSQTKLGRRFYIQTILNCANKKNKKNSVKTINTAY